MVYDFLLIMALAMAYGAAILTLKYAVFDIELAPDERASIGLGGFIGLVVILEVFFWYFWCKAGQTLGMRAWRIKLVQTDGSPPRLLQAAVRGLVAPISLLAGGLGYFWCLWSKDGKTWHDLASNTQVIELPKTK